MIQRYYSGPDVICTILSDHVPAKGDTVTLRLKDGKIVMGSVKKHEWLFDEKSETSSVDITLITF